MMTNEEQQRPAPAPQSHTEEDLDLVALAAKLWAGRRLIFKWCGVAALVALIIGFSIPKEYTVGATLAPEARGRTRLGGSISMMATMAGLNIGQNSVFDAIVPDLYPDVVASVPFAAGLFDVEVTDRKGKLQTTLSDYLLEHTRHPWWNAVFAAPFRLVGWGMSLVRPARQPEEHYPDVKEQQGAIRLTREQMRVVRELRRRITVAVDSKTSVVSLSVTMQDPLIAATVTEVVLHNLKNRITEYRTEKARGDLDYTQKLYDEAQQNYYRAQQAYAAYVDRNQNIVLRSSRTELERLQNEMNLAFSIYNQMAEQLQLARAKVQEMTPVYAVVQPPTVPLRASKPSKMMILLAMLFLAVVATSSWILFGRDKVALLRNRPKAEDPASRTPEEEA